jgi:hypothetical protein
MAANLRHGVFYPRRIDEFLVFEFLDFEFSGVASGGGPMKPAST